MKRNFRDLFVHLFKLLFHGLRFKRTKSVRTRRIKMTDQEIIRKGKSTNDKGSRTKVPKDT